MVEQADVGIVFWILSAVVLISGVMVVSLKNIFHCAIFLIFCLSGVAGIFVLLHAEFLAVAQVLIYVGAVSILMVFAIMLTTNLASRKIVQTNRNASVAVFGSLIFVVGAWWLIKATIADGLIKPVVEALPAENVLTLGKMLMTQYMLPFEVISVLLLAAMIGAIVLARRESA
jgi:NADH-quinone oxidoreductase subunit J